ncbi:PAS domain S-box protein (plasmid) [Halorubrum ezzemoulense]|uniref:PAS domain S-box protein n=1 Tax=Halorubrum ezzemoulense TaxID=337243 RepID=A0A481RLQ5_HALEZ|nr:PAS domain S-box protein [Halorubrum ezzemoulense]
MCYPAGPSSVDDELLAFAEALGGAESVDAVLTRSLSVIRSLLSDATVAYHGLDAGSDAVTTFELTGTTEAVHRSGDEAVPVSVVRSVIEAESVTRGDAFVAEADAEGWDTATTGDTATTDLFAPVADHGVLRVTLPSADGAADRTTALIERVASAAAAALNRVGGSREPDRERRQDAAALDAAALHQFHETTMAGAEFDAAVAELLSLARDYVELDVGIFSRVEDETYTVESVADRTGTYETGATFDAAEAVCAATLSGNPTEPVAFADVTETEYAASSAAEGVDAYIGVPVFVDGASYGTVAFFSEEPRSAPFRAGEREFVKLLAQWVGTEIERRHRFEELERYETILQAVDDPVYALDAAGEFTFVNEAAKREFGYGDEVIGADPSIGMDEADIARVREQIVDLIAEDERSKRAEFDLHTADGSRKIVENRIALIGDDEFRGSAGVLRDITSRKRRERQLTSIKRAIEQSADGFAILDNGEYTYVDETHVEMYGFESKAQLLGDSWRRLYDDDEIDRLEAEAFPALEAEGRWRGTVTGRRPDGTTFPTEISLTAVDDGRIVCTARDESERQRQREELELFQRAIEQAADGVAVLDGDEYTYIDETHVEMYGFESKAQLLGDSWRRLYDDDEIDRLEAEAFPALEAEGRWRGAVTGRRPDGTTFPAELSLTIIEDGRLVCTVRDETDRKERERELELKERAMDEATVAIQIADATRDDNPLVYVNDGFEQVTGYASEETLGRNPRFLQGDDTDPEQRARLRKAIERDAPVSLDIQNYRKDGTQYWSHLSITPVTDDQGTVRNYIGIQQDVTDRREREQKLFAERERFRLLLESVDEYAFLAVDEEGRIQTWNENAESLFGYDEEAAVGMSTAELHRTDDREVGVSDRLLDQARIAGQSAHEGWYVRADENRFYADVRYARLEHDDGTFRGYAMIVRDMTERRRQQRRTERFVEESDDVITVVDTAGTITYASGSSRNVFAHEPDDLVGGNLFDHAHPTDRKETMEAFFEAVERSDSNRELEFRLESGDGEWLNVEGQCRNMLDDGAVDGMLLYLRDVTDRRERARRFESVFNQTFQFAGLLNPDGTVVEVNDTEFAFGEETRETLVGERFCDTALWEHSDAARTDLRTAVERAAEGEGTRYETTMYGANGLVTVDLSVKPVTREDGDTSLIVVAGRDVSAEQRQRQHLDVVHRVLRHNMRNDLGKVRGWAELMCEESDRDARSEHLATLNRILDKWESMTERVKQIRRASQRIDQSTGADPDSLVADATAPVRDEYPDATISTEVSADALTRVPATLLDAIRELAENAANTGPDADVEVELSSPEDGWIEVSVRDDGPGLPQMEANALETGEETPLNHGNGLGLWMVRMITTQAGGDISVRTAEAGTDVRLRVPTE